MSDQWISGTVVRGDGRGAALGFPTANISLLDQSLAPTPGIYAAQVCLLPEDEMRPAVMHIGPRPTFPGAAPSIEIHLLDFPPRDLYGEQAAFLVVQKIRDVQKFATIEELAAAIADDCVRAKRVLTPSS